MTVAELIEKLKGLPQDLPVVVESSVSIMEGGGYEYLYADGADVRTLHVVNGDPLNAYLRDTEEVPCVHIS